MKAIRGLMRADDRELIQPLRAEAALYVWSRVEDTWAQLFFIVTTVGGE